MGLAETKARKAAYQRAYTRRFKERTGLSWATAQRRRNPKAAERHRAAEKKRWYADAAMRERHRLRSAKRRHLIKLIIFRMYGDTKCVCCGETELLFLSLDHINNNGAHERKIRPSDKTTHAFYARLLREGFPAGYQVLCMNCNFGKQMNKGTCPHKTRPLQAAA